MRARPLERLAIQASDQPTNQPAHRPTEKLVDCFSFVLSFPQEIKSTIKTNSTFWPIPSSQRTFDSSSHLGRAVTRRGDAPLGRSTERAEKGPGETEWRRRTGNFGRDVYRDKAKRYSRSLLGLSSFYEAAAFERSPIVSASQGGVLVVASLSSHPIAIRFFPFLARGLPVKSLKAFLSRAQ